MALQKMRQFTYQPSTKRRKQVAERDHEEIRRHIELPKAGDGRTSAGGHGAMLGSGLRLFLMLAAVAALAYVLSALG